MIKASIDLQDLRRRLYVKAKAETSWRFWGLYVHVCKRETLRAAYELAQKNDGAPGVDGVTFAAIEAQGVEAFLVQIRDELIGRTYAPLPARRQAIRFSCSGRRANARSPHLRFPLFGTGRMLVRPHNGGVDDQVFEIRVFTQSLENTLPNTFLGPSAKTLEHAIPVAKFARQITPWRSSPHQPKGAIAFKGRQSGLDYEGTAYVHSKICGAFGYHVTGSVSAGGNVTLNGFAPYVNSNCQYSGGHESVLKFELL